MRAGASTAKVLLLLALLAAVGTVGFAGPNITRRGALDGIRLGQLQRQQLTEALVQSGAMKLHPRPEVFDESPPAEVGILELRAASAAGAVFPSTAMARELASAHPEREFVSIAVDPRDLDDPLQGIRAHPFEKGAGWQRSACVTFFESGEVVAETTAGIAVHGGTSRGRPRKSWRLLFRDAFGATAGGDAILPGGRGDSLVLHSDWRRQPFVNPIGYELLARLGCEVPKTRPVRVVINGALQPRIYFATERLDESHLRARCDGQRIQRLREHDHQEPPSYMNLVNRIRTDPAFARDHGPAVMDTAAAERWLAGMLLLAPYDCKQGLAYRTEVDRRWRWVAWDVDWGLGPWPTVVVSKPVKHRDIVDMLRSPARDLRLAWFEAVMSEEDIGRARMLKRVRAALEHDGAADWWRETLSRYREFARRLLGPGDESSGELAALGQIEQWVRARPAALRAELAAAFGLSAPRRITVRVSPGCSVVVEGRRYERDWTGHAFDGERIELAAAAGAELVAAGEPVTEAMSHCVRGDVSFEVRPR